MNKTTEPPQQLKTDFLTKLALLAGVTQLLGGIPQVISAFNGNITGLNPVTWATWAIIGLIIAYYGYIHQKPPILFTNIGWFFINTTILISILIHS